MNKISTSAIKFQDKRKLDECHKIILYIARNVGVILLHIYLLYFLIFQGKLLLERLKRKMKNNYGFIKLQFFFLFIRSFKFE